MVAHTETGLVSDHPVCAKSDRGLFLDGAATPPFQGGEFNLVAASCGYSFYLNQGIRRHSLKAEMTTLAILSLLMRNTNAS